MRDNAIEANLKTKHLALKRNLAEMGSVVLALSGGVDSTLLLAVGKEALSDRIVAATARSPLYPQSVVRRAVELTQQLDVEHVILDSNELDDPQFTSNPPERCYLCKLELYSRLDRLARERGVATVIDGTQLDDTADYRPGMWAAAEFGVRSPLLEVGFIKEEVRVLSKELGLETWDITAGPCLASRVPCTEEIAVFQSFSEVISEADSKFVVVDTAPTGHTLLLLDATGAYHRDILRHAKNGKEVFTPLMRLQDSTWTKILIVTIPETTPVLEAAELQEDLRRAGIEPWAWVINSSLTAASTRDTLLAARARSEGPRIEKVQQELSHRLAIVPWSPIEPMGRARLYELSHGRGLG